MDLLIAFSLSNLCFINSWYLAEQIPMVSLNYYRRGPADATLLWATLIAVVLVGALFWAGWEAVKRSGNRLALRFAKGLFLLILSYPVEKLIRYMNPTPGEFSYVCEVALIALETTLLMGVMLVVLFGRSKILGWARQTTLVLALLFPSIAFNLTWSWMTTQSASAFRDGQLAGPVAAHKAPASRMIWMVFDEMDQGLAFDFRHPTVKMPNLDRLRTEGFYADRVTPLARWTMLALPALINGQALTRTELMTASDLYLWTEGQDKPVNWRSQPNLFTRARAAGFNTAIAGWHHPYCRVLNEQLTDCYWMSSEQGGANIEVEAHTKRIGLWRSVLFLLEWKAEDVVTALNIDFLSKADRDVQESLRKGQMDLYRKIREQALRMAADPKLDVMLLHWPTPHLYGIYDPATQKLSTDPKLAYLENLALVDRTVGEVQAALARSGLADRTTLLISSDHPFRREIWQDKFRWPQAMLDSVNANTLECVPFLVKFGGRSEGVEYHQPFSAVLTEEMAGKIARGEIRSAEELKQWVAEKK